MRWSKRWTRVLGLVVTVATLAAPTLGPLLDAGEPVTETRVEREHDPDDCAVHHDHRACIQLFASAAAPPPAPDLPWPADDRSRVAPPASEVRLTPRPIGLLGARAPPILPAG